MILLRNKNKSGFLFLFLFVISLSAFSQADTSYKYNGPFFQIGSLKLSTIKLYMDTVLDSEIKDDSVLIINIGTKPLSVSLSNTNENLSVSFSQNTILPQMKAYIKVSYNATEKMFTAIFLTG